MAEFGVDGEVELKKVEKCVDIVVSELADDDMVSVATMYPSCCHSHHHYNRLLQCSSCISHASA